MLKKRLDNNWVALGLSDSFQWPSANTASRAFLSGANGNPADLPDGQFAESAKTDLVVSLNG
ncbi:MAG: hypothetical protein ACJAYE_000241 [Candidatus Azotimanducaceae bacterium]